MGKLRSIFGGRDSTVAEHPDPPPDTTVSKEDLEILERVSEYTMTGPARIQALIDATRYVVSRGLDGDLVECGVWRGGSVLAMILTLQSMDVTDRDIHLFDTFEGMTEPTEHDRSATEGSAVEEWREADRRGDRAWPEMFGSDVFDEDSVRELVLSSGYPGERVHLVRGPVEETIPGNAPGEIALLRLDTDWYESTLHELQHLYPRLRDGGVLIIDDYGHWEGARRAVEEYFDAEGTALMLNRVDYTGRLAIKH